MKCSFLQSRYGNMTEPDTITSEEDILNVNFAETDSAGNIIENGINKGNSLLVKYFTPGFQKELFGKQKDATIQLQLSKAF